VANVPRLKSSFKESSVKDLNAIAKSFNKQFEGLNSATSCLSNKGDSKHSSFIEKSPIDNIWSYCPSELSESIVQHTNSDKNATKSETKETSSKQHEVSVKSFDTTKEEPSEGYKKLKIPKMSNFSLYPSFSSKILRAGIISPTSQVIAKPGLEESDFSFNATVLKNAPCDLDTTRSKTSWVTNTLAENTTFGHHYKTSEKLSQESTDDDFLIGRLTKAQRAAKVQKYLEKKKKRKWDKQVNYQSRKKVADTRPRYKGRFVSSEMAKEFAEDLKRDFNKRLEKDKVFITEIINRRTGKVKKVIFPTEESLRKYRNNAVV